MLKMGRNELYYTVKTMSTVLTDFAYFFNPISTLRVQQNYTQDTEWSLRSSKKKMFLKRSYQ